MQSWEGMSCYGNPPFNSHFMMQVVQKARLEKAEVLLVILDWPGQAWHQELLLLADRVHKLPTGVPLFAQGAEGGCILSPPPRWGVLAVHIPAGGLQRYCYLSGGEF
jgi:hypothetical protein